MGCEYGEGEVKVNSQSSLQTLLMKNRSYILSHTFLSRKRVEGREVQWPRSRLCSEKAVLLRKDKENRIRDRCYDKGTHTHKR